MDAVRWAVCAFLSVGVGCGGASNRKDLRDKDAAGGEASSLSGRAGTAGGGVSEGGEGGAVAGNAGGSGSSGTSEPPCTLDDARCNAAYRREVCGVEGWTETSFVCARTVAVDDEIGSYCVTKGDGSYRCWGVDTATGEPAGELAADDYVRVQHAAFGLIGVTEAGRLVAPNLVLPQDLPPVATFRATNMWGGHGVCPRFADDSFAIMSDEYDLDGENLGMQIQETVGPVRSAGCFFEGFASAVLTDGSIWSIASDAPSGGDFTEVTVSLRTFCAVETSGSIACFEPPFSCMRTSQLGNCAGPDLPRFPAGKYHSLTATYDAVCAIDEQGTLVCLRFDGTEMPIDGGPYVFAEGGRDVLCGVRRDGTTACFRQNALETADFTAFVSSDPSVDPGW